MRLRAWSGRGAVAAAMASAGVLVAVVPAQGAPPGTATLLPPPLPSRALLVDLPNTRGDLLLTRPDGGVRVQLSRVRSGIVTPVVRPGGALPGVPDRLMPAQGDVLVGFADQNRVDGSGIPFRVDPATGVATALPEPVAPPARMVLRGTDGASLVWDTANNPNPRGGAGLRVQPFAGSALRVLPVPAFNPRGATLDVSTSNALVTLTGSLALVNLPTGRVTPLPFADVGSGAVRGSLLGADRLVYLDVTDLPGGGVRHRVRSCQVAVSVCRTVLTTTDPVLGLVANAQGLALAVQPVTGPAVLRWGAFVGPDAPLTGSARVTRPVLTRAVGELVVQDPTVNGYDLLDPVTGARTRLTAFPDGPGIFNDGRLDPGALLTRPYDRTFQPTTLQRYPVQPGVLIGTPSAVGPAAAPGRELFVSGARTVVDDAPPGAATRTVTVRDGARVVGSVAVPLDAPVRALSGDYWVTVSIGVTNTTTVYRGLQVVATVPGLGLLLEGPVLLARDRTVPGSVTVTDLRVPATSRRIACPTGCDPLAVAGRRLLLRQASGSTVTHRVLDWTTGSVLYTSPAGLLGPGRLDGELLVWGTPAAVNSVLGPIQAVRVPVTGPVTGPVEVVPTGQLLDAAEGRALWSKDLRLAVTPVPAALGTVRPARLRSVTAAASFSPDGDGVADTWSFAADLDAALTGWTLTLRSPAGAVVQRLTGAAPLGAVRGSWAPPAGTAAGVWSWQLTGTTTSAGGLVGPLGETTITGTVTVTG